MKRALLIVGLFGMTLGVQTSAHAAWTLSGGYYWESYNGKYYALTKTGNAASWEEVRQEALALGGDLVVIDDAYENSWLTATMFNSPDYQSLPGYDAIDHLWIGLHQDPRGAEPAGGWTWVDGSPVTYSNWGVNEPSDGAPLSGEHIEDWGAIRKDMGSSWNDYSPTAWLDRGYDGIQGIMEFDQIPAAPAPGAVLLVALGSAGVRFWRRRKAL